MINNECVTKKQNNKKSWTHDHHKQLPNGKKLDIFLLEGITRKKINNLLEISPEHADFLEQVNNGGFSRRERRVVYVEENWLH